MFSIFTALFGGLYYGNKYSVEKSTIKESDKKRKEFITSMKQFEALYGVDISIENELMEYIRCGKHYEEICNILQDDLLFTLGEDWRKTLAIPNNRWENCEFLPLYHSYWIYHLLLSKKGKMDRRAMFSGYTWGVISNRPRDIKFMMCIEKNLIEAGVQDIELVCENRYGDSSYVKPKQFCTHSHHRLW